MGSSLTNKVLQFSEGSDGYLNISVPGHHPFLSAAVRCRLTPISCVTGYLFSFFSGLLTDIPHPQSRGRGFWDPTYLSWSRPHSEHRRCALWAERWRRWALGLPEPRKQSGGPGQRPFLCFHLCKLWFSSPGPDQPGDNGSSCRGSTNKLFCIGECGALTQNPN